MKNTLRSNLFSCPRTCVSRRSEGMKAPYFFGSLASRFGSLFHCFSHCFGVVLLLFLTCFLLTVSGHYFGVLVDCFGCFFKGFKCSFLVF